MSEKIFEHISEKGKNAIAKETRDAVQPVVKKLTEKFEKMGFNKKDVAPAIQKGLEDAKSDV